MGAVMKTPRGGINFSLQTIFEIFEFEVFSLFLDFASDIFIICAHVQSACTLHARHTPQPHTDVK